MAQRLALDAVLVNPNEMEIVCQNNVLREGLVALYLIGLQNLVEIFPDRLVLDIAENESALIDLEIRRPLCSNALGLMLNVNPFCPLIGKCLQQRLKSPAVGLLRLLVY